MLWKTCLYFFDREINDFTKNVFIKNNNIDLKLFPGLEMKIMFTDYACEISLSPQFYYSKI